MKLSQMSSTVENVRMNRYTNDRTRFLQTFFEGSELFIDTATADPFSLALSCLLQYQHWLSLTLNNKFLVLFIDAEDRPSHLLDL